MPTPLPDDVAAVLRSDSTAALAALMIISSAHRELMAWAARMTAGDAQEAAKAELHDQEGLKLKEREAQPRRPKANGHNGAARHKTGRKPNGGDARLAKRDEADSNLVEAMKASPGASIGDLARAIGKSRSTTVTVLQRLKTAGLVENQDRVWALVEEPTPREPPPRWVEPVSARDRAAQHHITA